MHQKTLDDLIKTLVVFRASLSEVEAAGSSLKNALNQGHKILTAGNGGSAADAMHLSEELVGRYNVERSSIPAICLAADGALITCIGNDYGFDRVFSRQVEGLGAAGDVLVVFSTSGKSKNIEQAIYAAKSKQVKTIALLGKNGGIAKGLADHEIIVPSQSTARIQEIHTLILHLWLDQIEMD
jgi:D-sedoheptulose 7-phosphate isomerase